MNSPEERSSLGTWKLVDCDSVDAKLVGVAETETQDFDGTSIGWVYCGFIGKLDNWHWLMVTGETNWWLLTIPNFKYHKNQAFHAYASVSSFLHTNLVVFTQKWALHLAVKT